MSKSNKSNTSADNPAEAIVPELREELNAQIQHLKTNIKEIQKQSLQDMHGVIDEFFKNNSNQGLDQLLKQQTVKLDQMARPMTQQAGLEPSKPTQLFRQQEVQAAMKSADESVQRAMNIVGDAEKKIMESMGVASAPTAES